MFTYQGKLTENGGAAGGAYQIQFKLFDALSAGIQVGPTLADLPVTVTGGIFTVQLDFGVTRSTGRTDGLSAACATMPGRATPR